MWHEPLFVRGNVGMIEPLWDLLIETGYLSATGLFTMQRSETVASWWRSPGQAATVWSDGGLFTRAGVTRFGNGYETITAAQRRHPATPASEADGRSTSRRMTFVLRPA